MDFQNFTNNQTFLERTFCSLEHSQGCVRSPQNVHPMSSAVLPFIGWKQTDRQTVKQSLYIEDFNEIIRRKQTK